MSIELTATLVTAAIQIAGLVSIAVMTYRTGRILERVSEKMNADDAALFLQGRRVEDVLKEMRQELKKG
jgi:hypothetical protein